MQWYKRDVDAALTGMAVLDLEERGAYNGVLDMLYGRDGDLPDDDELIARTLRVNPRTWRSVKTRLIAHGKIWVTSDAKIGAKRVEKTLNEARNYSETQSKRARKGWETKKKDSDNNDPLMPSGNANTLTTTPTSTERDTNVSRSQHSAPTLKSETPEGFEAWWKAYPRKLARGAAVKAYRKALAKTSPSELLTAVERFASECAHKEPQFIAHAATWLNGERWNDMPEPKPDFRNDRTARQTPLGGLYSGAAIALERREAQRQADSGTGDNPAQPLLDSGGGRTLEGATNLRLVG